MGGFFTLVEDRPTPKAVYNWRVYACAAVASFASCMIGYDSAFIGTTLALPSFIDEFEFEKMTKDHLALVKSNIVSVYQAGAFFGSLFAYATNFYLGRKKSLYIFSVIFIIGAGIMLASTRAVGLGPILGGRVLAGIGVGGSSAVVPMYISELAPPAVRGRLVGLYELGWQIGGLVGFWINYGLSETMAPSHKQWIIPFAVQIIPAGLLLIGAFFVPESPRWLIEKNQREEAIKNLCWIRQLQANDIYIVEEVSYIDTSVAESRQGVGSGFWNPFKALYRNKKLLWRLFHGTTLFMWQNGSGINAINYYSPTVFRSLGITGTSTAFLTTGIFGVVKTTMTIIWLLFLIDNLGRTKLLMVGAFGGSLCMWYIGGYIAYMGAKPGQSGSLTASGKATVFIFYLWSCFYITSWNGGPWVFNSEIYPQNVRGLGLACASASNWFWNFVISKTTPDMFNKMSYGVYFLFASVMLLSVPYVFFLIPETKSVPLEAMERLFEIVPARKAHGIVMAELREQEAEFRHEVEGAGLTTTKTNMRAEKLETISSDDV